MGQGKALVYRLYFRGPVHPGERGVGREAVSELLHSDTLFSALLSSLRLWRGNREVERWLAPFREGEPPFLLTSAFPFAGEVLFLPRPLKPIPGEEIEGKRLKGVCWLSPKAFDAVLKGIPMAAEVKENFLITPQEERLLPLKGDGLWKREMVPRVALDRSSGASQLFFVKRLYFAPECGLWFAVHYRDESFLPELEALLRILEDWGIGGERSRGCGQFTFKAGEAPPSLWPNFGEGESVTLSLWAPKAEELHLLKRSRYRLKFRSGWLLSPEAEGAFRSQEVYLIEEGAVVPKGAPLGGLSDVTPRRVFDRHPIYRYGFAYTVAGKGG